MHYMRWMAWLLLLPAVCWGFLEDELSRCVEVKSGGEYTYRLRLRNTDNVPLVVHLTQSDYGYAANGETYFPLAGTTPRSNAKWVELPDGQVVVPAQSVKDLFYTVRVPRDSRLSGSYWSVILIEPEAGHTVTQDEATIHVKVRYAHQIVTNLSGGGAQLKLAQTTLDHSQGSKLMLDIANVGERFLRPHCNVKIYDAAGKLARTTTIAEQNILPGSSIRYTVEVDGLTPQQYHGLLLLRDGECYFGERFTFQVLP